MTIFEARKEGTNILESSYEADLLLAHTLNVSKVFLLSNSKTELSHKDIKQFKEFVQRRRNNEPLQYILGYVYFMNIKVNVDNAVLIPRQDTETLVELAKELILKDKKKNLNILDMCTGSGCIAVSIMHDFKDIKNINMYAADISEDALIVAKKNAELNNVNNITFIKSDYFSNIPNITFDYILSNPPYIKTKEIDTLEPQVKNFEPVIALDGGNDGFDAYRKIISQSKNFLSGSLLLEAGIHQAEQIAIIMKEQGFQNIYSKKDLNNIDRVVHGIMK